MQSEDKSVWYFYLIPIIWGLGFTLTHNAVRNIDPGKFAFFRQLVALLCLLPFAFSYLKKISKQVILWSIIISLCNTSNILCQAYALTQINSTQIAFYVTLNIIFVPFFAYLLKIWVFDLIEVIAVIIGVISLVINYQGDLQGIGSGDIFGLVSSISIALSIVTTQKMLQSIKAEKVLMTFLSIFWSTCFLLCFLFTNSVNAASEYNAQAIFAILFQGAISTAFAYYIQLRYQQRVGATNAALILNLDLAFASFFGFFLRYFYTCIQ